MPSIEEQLAILRRGTNEIISEADLAEKLKSGKPLRVKLGVDPTVGSVTLGWAVVLRKLRDFQKLGHTAVLIIGDFTAMIGDPSGKSKTRPQLTREQVEANVKLVSEQIYKILDPEKTEIRYNRDWLGPMDFEKVIRLCSRYTVARILERDDFKKRLDDGRPIGMHEILYPLCQGYDSVAVESDVELGGNDQKFNNLVGRDLMGQYGHEGQIVMLCPLLLGIDGKDKMSQSLGNYIGVAEDPNQIFGKVMSIPDEVHQAHLSELPESERRLSMIRNWFELCTDVPMAHVEAMILAASRDQISPKDLKRRLAIEIVDLYHPSEAPTDIEPLFGLELPGVLESGEVVYSATGSYVRTTGSGRYGHLAIDASKAFKAGTVDKEIPSDVPEYAVPGGLVVNESVGLTDLLVAAGLTESKSFAKRLIKGGGVSLNGERIDDILHRIKIEELDGMLVKSGKRAFTRLKLQ